jgi:cytidylate kinase
MAPLSVTISSTHGAGGHLLGPRVADRLGVPFLDRAIPGRVAERLAVPLEHALRHEEGQGAAIRRLLAQTVAGLAGFGGVSGIPADVSADEFLVQTERTIREAIASTGAVISGRGAAVWLGSAGGVLHVRLDGPPQRRGDVVAAREHVDPETAQRQVQQTDRARATYVRQFYRADWADPRFYHLIIDSLAIDDDAVVEIIVTGARGRRIDWS